MLCKLSSSQDLVVGLVYKEDLWKHEKSVTFVPPASDPALVYLNDSKWPKTHFFTVTNSSRLSQYTRKKVMIGKNNLIFSSDRSSSSGWQSLSQIRINKMK